ncbi:MAG: hypothetical protein K2M90_05360, partial [Treponemataceae bacterium]|nr:hypothetical protein [Treponemataceae bacterium]
MHEYTVSMDKNTARVKVAICAGGGGSIDRPPSILYTFSMTPGATTVSTKNATFLAKALDTRRVAVIIEHRTQNTEHRTQNTEH